MGGAVEPRPAMTTLATLLLRPHLSTEGQILTPDVAVERLSVVAGGATQTLPLQRILTSSPIALGPRPYRARAAFALAGADGRHFLMPACTIEADGAGDPGLALLAGQVVIPRRAIVLEEVSGEVVLSLSNGSRHRLDAAGAAGLLGERWPLGKGSLVVLAAADAPLLDPGELVWEFAVGGETWTTVLPVELAEGVLP